MRDEHIMTEPINYFEHCETCGLIWDATICADSDTACPYCAYVDTADELYDTRNELEDMENERDMAVEETSNLQYDLDEKETELYDMTEKADRLDDDLLEATEKIEELEAQL